MFPAQANHDTGSLFDMAPAEELGLLGWCNRRKSPLLAHGKQGATNPFMSCA